VGGERAFDDDRFPDAEGFACCFWCGRKVDPADPNRVTYSPNATACEFIPAHKSCLAGDGRHMERVMIAAMTAINEMGAANIRRAREAARCTAPPVREL